jgi:Kef-type K+ transport system membrane component KefB
VYRKLENRVLLTVLVGTVFLAAGVARSAEMSTIFVCFVAGLVFGRASRRSEQVTKMLIGVRRPFVTALFFFAGLEWVTGPLWTMLLIVPFVLLRWLGRSFGGWIGARLTKPHYNYGPVTLSSGGLSVAFILSLRLVYADVPGIREVYAPLLLSIIFIELLSTRPIRRWLIDVADVPPEAVVGDMHRRTTP